MKQNQIHQSTCYDRYPEVFSEINSICGIKGPSQIMSFGCASGLECKTLAEKYFVNAQIHGVDIDTELIQVNIKANQNSRIHYHNNMNDFKLCQFDLVFAMSVLCRWPEGLTSKYTFALFEETLTNIDQFIQPGGLLCIYNSKYRFTDTEVSHKYIAVATSYKQSGFVYKYDKQDNALTEHYPYFLFRKLEEGKQNSNQPQRARKAYHISNVEGAVCVKIFPDSPLIRLVHIFLAVLKQEVQFVNLMITAVEDKGACCFKVSPKVGNGPVDTQEVIDFVKSAYEKIPQQQALITKFSELQAKYFNHVTCLCTGSGSSESTFSLWKMQHLDNLEKQLHHIAKHIIL